MLYASLPAGTAPAATRQAKHDAEAMSSFAPFAVGWPPPPCKNSRSASLIVSFANVFPAGVACDSVRCRCNGK